MEFIKLYQKSSFESSKGLQNYLREMQQLPNYAPSSFQLKSVSEAVKALSSQATSTSQVQTTENSEMKTSSTTSESQVQSTDRAVSQSRPVSAAAAIIASKDVKTDTVASPKQSQKHEANSFHAANPIGQPKRCKCKRSKCLKFYCDCFAANLTCTEGACSCVDCWNTSKPIHASARAQAIAFALDRNPAAFTAKEVVVEHRGCNCKRSGCLKKYCECYASHRPCSQACKCIDCENRGPDVEEALKKALALGILPNPLSTDNAESLERIKSSSFKKLPKTSVNTSEDTDNKRMRSSPK